MTFAPMTATLYGRAFKYRLVITLLDCSVVIIKVRTIYAARKVAAAHNVTCWNF